jgi:hypothetical protein
MPNVIYETRRTDQNFFELLKMANSVKKRAIRGDVYPERGKKCDDCDMKGHCDKQLEHVNTGKYYDKHDQGLLGFELPMFARKSRIGRLSVVPEKPKSQVQQPITKSERNIKEPQFRLRYPKPEDQPAQKT